MTLLTNSQQLMRVEKKINSFLTKMQRDRNARVNLWHFNHLGQIAQPEEEDSERDISKSSGD